MDPQTAYRLARPLLFSLSPETAHDLVIAALERLGLPGSPPPLPAEHRRRLSLELWGLTLQSPVGLAAGFDKNARAHLSLAQLGFGFLEVGTVTPQPQAGNPRPRLFRLTDARALINRLGFNNEGASAMRQRLQRRAAHRSVPLGINIGRNRETPNERAAEDYVFCLELLHPYADFLVINVSSPNTPGLRRLQDPEHLFRLVQRLQAANGELAATAGEEPKPLLLKLAPELGGDELDAVSEAALAGGLRGIIAANTTTQREPVAHLRHGRQAGGLSGPPLAPRAEQVLAALYRRIGDQLPLIGVGGIEDARGAYRRIRAGASLVQVYTGLVYHGPGLPLALARGLAESLAADGYDHLQEAVGVDARRYPEPDARW